MSETITKPAASRPSAARHRAQLAEAAAQARLEGEMDGFVAGWRRGAAAGFVLGAAMASVGWAVYLTLAAPAVAPPSATRLTLTTLHLTPPTTPSP